MEEPSIFLRASKVQSARFGFPAEILKFAHTSCLGSLHPQLLLMSDSLILAVLRGSRAGKKSQLNKISANLPC